VEGEELMWTTLTTHFWVNSKQTCLPEKQQPTKGNDAGLRAKWMDFLKIWHKTLLLIVHKNSLNFGEVSYNRGLYNFSSCISYLLILGTTQCFRNWCGKLGRSQSVACIRRNYSWSLDSVGDVISLMLSPVKNARKKEAHKSRNCDYVSLIIMA
jgi:hypothetical protein